MLTVLLLWMVQTSPGPLSVSHAKLACVACHDANQGAAPDVKCRACHDTQPLKLHAQQPFTQLACETCHREHRGAVELSGWKAFRLDHARTGFVLDNDHATLPCTSRCHPARDRAGIPLFRGASASCLACHPASHAKQYARDDDCRGCHAPLIPGFDHATTTFALGSAHAKVACATCHTRTTTAPSSTCEGCHASRSPHGTRFATMPCAACHGVDRLSFRAPTFKHATFTTTGMHAQLACRDCHPGADFAKAPRFGDCMACHTKTHVDDRNPKGKYTNANCLTCHFQPSIHPGSGSQLIQQVHGPQGSFSLGKTHRTIGCMDCHRTRGRNGKPTFSGLSATCTSCHPVER